MNMMVTPPIDLAKEKRHLGELAPMVIKVAVAIGMLGIAGTAWLAYGAHDGGEHFYRSYLVAFVYFLSLSLGALFFVVLQHLTHSGWSVVLRRMAEAVAANLPVLAVLAIPILFGLHHLYHWSDPEVVAGDHLLQGKAGYLNVRFFLIRMVMYFAVWAGLSRFYFRSSLRQDETGDPALTLKMERLSGPAIVLYAVTQTFASFDLLMSLDAHWFSTIYGVYFFAGSILGFFAMLPIIFYLLQRSGRLTHSVTTEHFHDMGKLAFAFTVFWAYIAFSQFMLIWYANMPEETGWYLRRQQGQWAWVSLALLFGHFVIPFLALISRYPKRRRGMIVIPTVWILLMHWLDIYWLVMPEVSQARVPFSMLDLTCFLAVGGILVAAAAHRMRRRALVCEKDPRVAESLRFENA